jgi:stearoyl-CoA desaturase (delta-9 desaturase)
MATQLDLTDEILDRQTLSTVIDSDDVEAEREEAQLAAAIARKVKTPEDILVDEDPKNLPYDWPTVIWIGVVHVGALAAPFFFTWKALGLFAFLCWLTGSIGVCMGYHRQLTHGAFNTYRPIRWLLALLGGLSGEGSALTWVANHRKHHLYSDKDGDPHSPRRGAWWAHMLWLMPDFGHKYRACVLDKYAPDLARDPVMRFLHKFFLPSHVLLGGLLFAIGYFGWDAYTGWSFVVWGMFVRLVYVLHVTWFVNSATHMWGYRNYETTDDSRNLWWVGILAFGEGWHNNHHAFQRMARQGHKWWEVDMTYWSICALEKLGLAWNVQHDIPKHGKPA